MNLLFDLSEYDLLIECVRNYTCFYTGTNTTQYIDLLKRVERMKKIMINNQEGLVSMAKR